MQSNCTEVHQNHRNDFKIRVRGNQINLNQPKTVMN